MKFKEIINKSQWDDIRAILYDYYYKDDEDYEILYEYERIFNSLKILKIEDCNNMRLYVEKNSFNDEEYIEVVGRNGTLNKDLEEFEFYKGVNEEVANSEVTYALEMIKWEQWLDMNVPIDVFKNFSIPEIVAHCLYEMTFMGFSQDKIQSQVEEINKAVEDIKKGKVKGKVFNSVEELLKDLNKEDEEDEDNKEM